MADFLYAKGIEQAARALDWCVRRQRTLASNIVNRDTPGYLAKDVDFGKVMEQIYAPTGPDLERTDRAHLSIFRDAPSSALVVKLWGERLDGNTVNLSEEMASLAENSYRYQAMIRFIGGKLQTLKRAIQGG